MYDEDEYTFSIFFRNLLLRIAIVIGINYLIYTSWVFMILLFKSEISIEGGITNFYQYIPIYLSSFFGLIIPILLVDTIVKLHKKNSSNPLDDNLFYVRNKFFLISELLVFIVTPIIFNQIYLLFLRQWMDFDSLGINNAMILTYYVIVLGSMSLLSVFLLYFSFIKDVKRVSDLITVLMLSAYIFYIFPIYIVALSHQTQISGFLMLEFIKQYIISLVFIIETGFSLFGVFITGSFIISMVSKIKYGWKYQPDTWKHDLKKIKNSPVIELIEFVPVDSIEYAQFAISKNRPEIDYPQKYYSLDTTYEASVTLFEILNNLPETRSQMPIMDINVNFSDDSHLSFKLPLDNSFLRELESDLLFDILLANQLFNRWANQVKLSLPLMTDSFTDEIIKKIYEGEIDDTKRKDLHEIIIKKLLTMFDDLKIIKSLSENEVIFYSGYKIRINDIGVVNEYTGSKYKNNKTIGIIKSIDITTGKISMRTKKNEMHKFLAFEFHQLTDIEKEQYYNDLMF